MGVPASITVSVLSEGSTCNMISQQTALRSRDPVDLGGINTKLCCAFKGNLTGITLTSVLCVSQEEKSGRLKRAKRGLCR